MLPVVPLQERGPEKPECEHVAWEVLGTSSGTDVPTGMIRERRKCADCGHRFSEVVFAGEPDEDQTPAEPVVSKPPAVAYGHAQVVTYQDAIGNQYDLLVQETTVVSIQNGVLHLQQPEGSIAGIVGVRPYLVEVNDGADAAS